MSDSTFHLDFEPLRSGALNLSKAYGAFLAESAAHCLTLRKHSNPVSSSTLATRRTRGTLDWGGVEPPGGSYADLQEATEYGACGIALVIAVGITGMKSVERSVKGTGIDYWLGADLSADGIFQGAARLEVSGILDGDDAKIATRLMTKLRQTSPSDLSGLPAYVAVVEFRKPETRFVRKPEAQR